MNVEDLSVISLTNACIVHENRGITVLSTYGATHIDKIGEIGDIALVVVYAGYCTYCELESVGAA